MSRNHDYDIKRNRNNSMRYILKLEHFSLGLAIIQKIVGFVLLSVIKNLVLAEETELIKYDVANHSSVFLQSEIS